MQHKFANGRNNQVQNGAEDYPHQSLRKQSESNSSPSTVSSSRQSPTNDSFSKLEAKLQIARLRAARARQINISQIEFLSPLSESLRRKKESLVKILSALEDSLRKLDTSQSSDDFSESGSSRSCDALAFFNVRQMTPACSQTCQDGDRRSNAKENMAMVKHQPFRERIPSVRSSPDVQFEHSLELAGRIAPSPGSSGNKPPALESRPRR